MPKTNKSHFLKLLFHTMIDSSHWGIKNHSITNHIPARTGGPTGLNDQGDPNVAALLGFTPGTLGLNDCGDPLLSFFSMISKARTGVVFRKAQDGSPLAPHLKQATTTALENTQNSTGEPISLTSAQEMALKITTVFEGGKSMNYAALADDFDGQGTSFGLIQWNFGQNTLGPLLKRMLDRDSAAFAACFGSDSNYEDLKLALIGYDRAGQLTWVRTLLSTNRPAWRAAFTAIGSVASFNIIQLDQAIAKYHPLVSSAISKLRSLDSVIMKDLQFRSYAALFDLCVQQHGIDKAWDSIKSRVKAEKPKTQLALVTIAVTERAKKASSQWVSDCMSRRMGILNGKPFESKHSDITKNRKNSQFSLVVSYGDKIVSGI